LFFIATDSSGGAAPSSHLVSTRIAGWRDWSHLARGKLLMPNVNLLETLQMEVPRKALCALPVCSGLHPVTPSESDASQSISISVSITWADLLETQPWPLEKSFDLK